MIAIVEKYDKKETRKFYKIKHTDCCSFVCIFKDDFDIINYRDLHTPSDAIIKCPRCGKDFIFICKIKEGTPIDVDYYKEIIKEISEDEYNKYLSKSDSESRLEQIIQDASKILR